jgi:hypothetical protein
VEYILKLVHDLAIILILLSHPLLEGLGHGLPLLISYLDSPVLQHVLIQLDLRIIVLELTQLCSNVKGIVIGTGRCERDQIVFALVFWNLRV